jgi:hypothetical protein
MMVNLPCLMGSCPNFLRPTCSYTECRLSFLTGSRPTERTSASYNSCLCFDFTDLFDSQSTDIQWTLYPVSLSWSWCGCSTCRTSSLLGFFPEPCSISESSGTQQGPGIVMLSACFAYAANVSCFAGCLMSINIFFGS